MDHDPTPEEIEDTCSPAAKRVAELERELIATRVLLDKSEAYCRKMDGILEEVGGVTVSCINPYEDLKRALLSLKATRDGKRHALRQ